MRRALTALLLAVLLAVPADAGQIFNPPRQCEVLTTDISAVGNVGGGTDPLMSYTVPAGTLTAATPIIRVTGWFTTAANGNTKTFTFEWGATSVSIVSAAWNSVTASMTFYVVRTGTNTQDVYGRGGDSAGPTFRMPARATATETETADVVLRFTGESGSSANDDAVQRMMLVEACG